MKVFNGFDNLPHFTNPVVTVGSYDGVHAGHRKLLGKIGDTARETGGESVVVTFSPHPREVLGGGEPVRLLTTLKEKTILLEQAGIDNLIVAPFTREFSKLSSYDFVKHYLIDKIGVRTLVVGYNHHFGHNKTGDFDYLDRMGDRFGFDIYMVPRHDVDDDKVSSTIIRKLICEGKVAQASKFLGYPYFIVGRIDQGGAFVPDELSKLLPPQGRYAVSVSIPNDGQERTELFVSNDGILHLASMTGVAPGSTLAVTFI